MPRPVAHVEVAQARLVGDAVPPALDEAVEPLLDLALGGVRAQRQELVGRRALGVRGVELSPAAGSVVRAGVDPEELVLRGQPVEQPQVAARVHVRPAAEDVRRDLDPAHLGEDGALLVHRPVERQQARLEHELLLGAVEDLRLHTGPERLGRGLPDEPLGHEPLEEEAVLPDHVAVRIGRRVADDHRREVARLQCRP